MEGQGENDELYPIAVLIDELKVPELQKSGLGSMSAGLYWHRGGG